MAGLEPIVIKHSSLRGWEFPKTSVEITHRFSEAVEKQVGQAMRKMHPHLSVDRDSMVRRLAEAAAMSLAKIMSPERLIEIISAKDQATKKEMVDVLIGEIRDHLSSRAVYMEFPLRRGRKPSEERRDAKILELRERKGLNFGEIAVRLRLGSKGRYIARSAYRRAVKDREKFIRLIYPRLREIGADYGIQLIEENADAHPSDRP